MKGRPREAVLRAMQEAAGFRVRVGKEGCSEGTTGDTRDCGNIAECGQHLAGVGIVFVCGPRVTELSAAHAECAQLGFDCRCCVVLGWVGQVLLRYES